MKMRQTIQFNTKETGITCDDLLSLMLHSFSCREAVLNPRETVVCIFSSIFYEMRTSIYGDPWGFHAIKNVRVPLHGWSQLCPVHNNVRFY